MEAKKQPRARIRVRGVQESNMDDLDFSILTDDQLLALVRAACVEAVQRGSASTAAAQDAYQTACMEAQREALRQAERIKRELAEREAQKQWIIRKGIAQEAARIFGGCGFETAKLHVVVWRKGGEQRVFVQYGFDDTIFTLYITGNLGKSIPPGYTQWRRDADLRANKDLIAAFLKAVAETCPEADICIGTALQYQGEAAPLGFGYQPQELEVVP